MPLDRPLPDDHREGLKMLWSVAEEQQVDINRHRDSLHKVWHVAPAKPREGMLVYADGTNWNPGSGAGYYVYYAGAWHAMTGGGGGGGGVVTSVFTRIGDVVAVTGDYTAAQVTNAVSVLGSYPNPTWIPSYAYSKLTGVPTSFTPAAHTHAAADVTTGVMAVARLGTGTPNSSTYLRGDSTWATVATGQNQTPWLSHIDGANFSLTNVKTIGIGTSDGSYYLRVRTGVDQNILISPTGGTAAMQVTNDAVSAYVPMTYAASVHAFMQGNVGIGTYTPAAKLVINGATASDTPGAAHQLQYSWTDVPIFGWRIASGNGTLVLDCLGGAWIPAIAINRGEGNVGIGNSSPGSYAGAALVLGKGSPSGAAAATQLQIGEGTSNTGYRLQIGYSIVGGSWSGCVQTMAASAGAPLYLNPLGGNIAIGSSSASYQLHLSTDTAAKLTTTTWTVTSDARTKRNIRDLEGGLEVINKLRPIEAEFNGLGGTPDGHRVVSFLAHEIREVLPHTVGSRRGKIGSDETEILDFNMHEVLMHLVLAVKQLGEKIQ